MTTFSTKLKLLRLNAGLTQPQLAQQLGISRSAVGMYEAGSREPDLTTLCRIADLFDIDLDSLVGRLQPPSHDNLKLALFGNADVPDSCVQDVLIYAEFIKSKHLSSCR